MSGELPKTQVQFQQDQPKDQIVVQTSKGKKTKADKSTSPDEAFKKPEFNTPFAPNTKMKRMQQESAAEPDVEAYLDEYDFDQVFIDHIIERLESFQYINPFIFDEFNNGTYSESFEFLSRLERWKFNRMYEFDPETMKYMENKVTVRAMDHLLCLMREEKEEDMKKENVQLAQYILENLNEENLYQFYLSERTSALLALDFLYLTIRHGYIYSMINDIRLTSIEMMERFQRNQNQV